MKNRILIVVLLLAAQCTMHAQITTTQLCLRDTTAGVLYQGMDNIVVINNLAGNNRVTLNGQTITSTGVPQEGRPANERRFSIQPPRAATCTLQVFDGTRQIFSRIFEVRNTDNEGWRIRIGTAKDTLTTVAQIMAAPYVHTDFDHTLLKRKYLFHITRYKLSIINRGNVVIERTKNDRNGLDGQAFDAETQAYIRKLVKGDQLMLEDVSVRTTDGAIRSVTVPARWTIK